ncbi:ABC transporter ATP-binding protein [Saccharopolyspora sp. NPDC002578]
MTMSNGTAARGAIPHHREDATVSVRDLVYRYGEFVAVEGVSFSIRRGEVFALLGTNGAGKTTTLEVLEGFRKPTSGSVEVLGHSPFQERFEVQARTGIMLQESGLIDEMTVVQMLELWQRLSPRDDDPSRLLDLVHLVERRDVPVSSLSGGEKRRLDFAMSVWGSPEFVVLDEPTTGLDPQSRDQLWQVVQRIRDDGATILLTTHYLEEAEALADRVAIMNSGRVAVAGTMSEVLATVPARISAVSTSLPGHVLGGLDREVLGELTLTTEGAQVFLSLETRQLQRDLTRLLDWARQHDVYLDELRASPASLSEVFMAVPRNDSAFGDTAVRAEGARN